MFSIRLNRWTIAAFAFTALAVPGSLSAQTPDHPPDRILVIEKSMRVARLVVGVPDLKTKKYPSAQANINQSIRGPITDLVATLLSGRAASGAGDATGVVTGIGKGAGPEWYPLFKALHAGMILELSGKGKDAGTR